MGDISVVKGMMPRSHVERVRQSLGEDGVRELEHRYGKSLDFKNDQDVPIAEERKIVFLAFDLLGMKPEEGETRDFAVGRFHFRNFASSPYGYLAVQKEVCADWKKSFLNQFHFSSHMVKDDPHILEDLGPTKVGMEWFAADFSIDHWRGWVTEWASACGLHVEVTGKVLGPDNHHYYTIEWAQ